MKEHDMREAAENLLSIGTSFLNSKVPNEARRHFRNAFKETLLGMLAVVEQSEKNDDVKKEKEPDKSSSVKINITE